MPFCKGVELWYKLSVKTIYRITKNFVTKNFRKFCGFWSVAKVFFAKFSAALLIIALLKQWGHADPFSTPFCNGAELCEEVRPNNIAIKQEYNNYLT